MKQAPWNFITVEPFWENEYFTYEQADICNLVSVCPADIDLPPDSPRVEKTRSEFRSFSLYWNKNKTDATFVDSTLSFAASMPYDRFICDIISGDGECENRDFICYDEDVEKSFKQKFYSMDCGTQASSLSMDYAAKSSNMDYPSILDKNIGNYRLSASYLTEHMEVNEAYLWALAYKGQYESEDTFYMWFRRLIKDLSTTLGHPVRVSPRIVCWLQHAFYEIDLERNSCNSLLRVRVSKQVDKPSIDDNDTITPVSNDIKPTSVEAKRSSVKNEPSDKLISIIDDGWWNTWLEWKINTWAPTHGIEKPKSYFQSVVGVPATFKKEDDSSNYQSPATYLSSNKRCLSEVDSSETMDPNDNDSDDSSPNKRSKTSPMGDRKERFKLFFQQFVDEHLVKVPMSSGILFNDLVTEYKDYCKIQIKNCGVHPSTCKPSGTNESWKTITNVKSLIKAWNPDLVGNVKKGEGQRGRLFGFALR